MNRRSTGWMGIAAIALILSLLVGHGWQRLGSSAMAEAAVPVIAQEPATEAPTTTASGPALSGTYEDPQGNFQIGLLEGFANNPVAGSPLFQTPDGSLAYSVVRVPLTTEAPLSEFGLVQVTQEALGNGEGFQTQTFNTVPGGGLQIAWSGRLSQGAAPPQPVSGTVLAKQQGSEAYLLVVAALEAAAPQVPQVISTLVNTLEIL